MSSEIAKKLLSVGRLKPIAAPKVPKGKAVFLIEDDDHQEDGYDSVSDNIGAAYFITYIKTNNSQSQRRVSVKKISKNAKGNILLHCYCHERQALRAFRADRIQEAIDLATGEVIQDFLSALNNISGHHVATACAPPSQTAVALSQSKHALNVLVFLGRCDDRLHPFEIDIICQYLMNLHFDLPWIESEIHDHINRLYPDHDTFIASIEHVSDSNQLHKLVRYACQMIQADDIITNDEHKFLEEMRPYAENA